MNWVEERDRLIADTLAFVEQVAGAQPDLVAQLRAAVDAEVKAAKNPKQILPPSDFKPGNLSDLRNEIRDRVETFRLRQQALQDEREASYREGSQVEGGVGQAQLAAWQSAVLA